MFLSISSTFEQNRDNTDNTENYVHYNRDKKLLYITSIVSVYDCIRQKSMLLIHRDSFITEITAVITIVVFRCPIDISGITVNILIIVVINTSCHPTY